MFRLKAQGSLAISQQSLKRLQKLKIQNILNTYGPIGCRALASATPRESGETARSWEYRIEDKNGTTTISWYNTHVVDGVPIALILQYGHGTGTGGYVQGRDYINPAMEPIFAQIRAEIGRVVTP